MTSQNRVNPLAFAALTSTTGLGGVRGMGAWLAVVRTYQKCADVLSQRIQPLGIKLAQHDVMMNLLMTSNLTQQQLAERSFVTKSHMSAVLVDMAKLGWISREGSAQDKRSKVITLTPQGLHLAQQAFEVQAQVVNLMMGQLTDKQVGDLQSFSLNAFNALDASVRG